MFMAIYLLVLCSFHVWSMFLSIGYFFCSCLVVCFLHPISWDLSQPSVHHFYTTFIYNLSKHHTVILVFICILVQFILFFMVYWWSFFICFIWSLVIYLTGFLLKVSHVFHIFSTNIEEDCLLLVDPSLLVIGLGLFIYLFMVRSFHLHPS